VLAHVLQHLDCFWKRLAIEECSTALDKGLFKL